MAFSMAMHSTNLASQAKPAEVSNGDSSLEAICGHA